MQSARAVDSGQLLVDSGDLEESTGSELPALVSTHYPLSTTNDWVAATHTRNFCKGEPLLDFLAMHGERLGYERDERLPGWTPEVQMLPFILEKGREFELRVMAALAEKAEVVIINVDEEPPYFDGFERTLKAMEDGAEVIAQGVVQHEESRTFGRPDLLVRVDVLERLFGVVAGDGNVPFPIGHRYVAVDIKYKTFQLQASGKIGSSEDKKAQMAIYNRALGAMQGWTPEHGYLLGRVVTPYKGDKDEGDCFTRLAPVAAHDGLDLADQAVAWVRRLRAEGADWTVEPEASLDELIPHATNTQDTPWHHAKKGIVARTRPLTALWFVTPKNTGEVLAKGIKRWDDPRLTADMFGLSDNRTRTLARILATQRGEIPFEPGTILALRDEWRVKTGPEFFVDFETTSDLNDDFSTFPKKGGIGRIFMVGCGHEEDGEWRFRCFIADRMDDACERVMLLQWLLYMLETNARLGGTELPTVFHWSPAETSVFEKAYNSAQTRLPGDWPPVAWFDLLNKVIKIEPVTVKGALAFGLKSIAKAMHSHGLIETNWEDGPMDGLAAMIGGWHCDKIARESGGSMLDVPLMQEILRYNEVDCKVMWEIISYLRKHH